MKSNLLPTHSAGGNTSRYGVCPFLSQDSVLVSAPDERHSTEPVLYTCGAGCRLSHVISCRSLLNDSPAVVLDTPPVHGNTSRYGNRPSYESQPSLELSDREGTENTSVPHEYVKGAEPFGCSDSTALFYPTKAAELDTYVRGFLEGPKVHNGTSTGGGSPVCLSQTVGCGGFFRQHLIYGFPWA
ncbi:hypothetical protein Bbelb_149080 [Branchiostoma belcheri]|nr:hypothetical protein Bbelb_149080 [Branchiostoma belcheri]